jgi:hypothetical protein
LKLNNGGSTYSQYDWPSHDVYLDAISSIKGSIPPHNNLNAVAEQLSPNRLSRGLSPVVHLSTRPILGQVSRSHDAALGAREEPQAELREGGVAWLRKKFA